MTVFDEKQTWNNNILKDLMSFLAKEDRFSRVGVGATFP